MNIAKVFPKLSTLRLLNCVPKYHAGILVTNQRWMSLLNKNETRILCPQSIQSSSVIQKRFKKKMSGKQNKSGSSKKQQTEEEDEEEDSDDDDDDEDKDKSGVPDEIVQTTTPSLQIFSVGKVLFNISRATFEEKFNKKYLRVNGEIVLKNYQIQANDEIDLINGIHFEDRDKLEVRRVIIQMVNDKAESSGRTKIAFKRINKLTVDNYKADPFVV